MENNHNEEAASSPKDWDDLLDLAQSWMAHFAEKGLSRQDSASGFIVKDAGSHRILHSSPVLGEAHLVQLDGGQVVWLQPSILVTPGYRNHHFIKVFDSPSSSDSAIIAALTLVNVSPIDPERVEIIIPFLERLDEELARLPKFTGPPTSERVSKHMKERSEVTTKVLRNPEFKGASA
jgi:hypothetical protein